MKKSWIKILNNIDSNIFKTVDEIYKNENIFPIKDNVFNSLNYFELKDTKVVIIGQDCYINSILINDEEIPQANGLAFSVNACHKKPPSLKNIFKEMKETIDNFNEPENGDLTYLAKQGVLLLNSSLTVEKGKSNSHSKLWIHFTDLLIKYISDNTKNVVFILWGNYARSKKKFINNDDHYIIEGVHPSPLSARYNLKGTDKSFFGHGYFNRCNEYLKKNNKEIILW